MCSLVDRLCVLLQCTKEQLPAALEDVESLQYVTASLRDGTVHTTHLSENRCVRVDGVSFLSAARQFAYNGYLKITVQQHMYCAHKVRLHYPDLPCIMMYGSRGHVDYFPIELLWYSAQ